jgi:hypothetical protein
LEAEVAEDGIRGGFKLRPVSEKADAAILQENNAVSEFPGEMRVMGDNH